MCGQTVGRDLETGQWEESVHGAQSYFVQGGSGVLISDALPGLDVAPDPCHLAASDHV